MDQGFEPETKRNKRSKVGFPCNKCEYVATRAFTLKIHIENQHERVKNHCSQCEYAATTASDLKKHIKSKE